MINSIKGAIFDIDGTLLDSMTIWENVAADFLLSRGIEPRPDLNSDLATLGGHEIPGYFQIEYGIHESVDDIKRGLYELLEEFYFFKAMPKSGVFPVLDMLREHGVRMCVATATDRRLIEPALHRCGLFEYFERIFTCSEEVTSKSSPDIYLRAAAFLGCEINETLVVEDALYAMQSAKSVGFPIIAVYDYSAKDQQEDMKALCDYYFISMDDMPDTLKLFL